MKLVIILESNNKVSLALHLNEIKKYLVNKQFKHTILGLPIKNKKITLLRSPHVNKKSKETYKIVLHKMVLEIFFENKVSFYKFKEVLKKIEVLNNHYLKTKLEIVL
jgi:ribosomal protein S10